MLRWQAYGNDNSSLNDWTGGDGAISVRLPDGRVVWMFGDTYLGKIYPTNPPSRLATQGTVANTFVIEKDGVLVETRVLPIRPIPPEAGYNFWPRDGTVEAGKLKVFAQKLGAGQGAYLATFSLPGLTLERIDPTPTTGSSSGISWGSIC